MLTTDARVLELVRKAIAASREETRDLLEHGQPHVVIDHAAYRQYVGYLSGLAFLEAEITKARQQAEQEAGTRPAAA